MSFLRRLLGGHAHTRAAPAPAEAGPITHWPKSDEEFSGLRYRLRRADPTVATTVHVVGTSHYQGSLELAAGGRTIDGGRDPEQTAILLPEPSNPYDPHAVRVVVYFPVVGIHGMAAGTVGYLSREDAVAYRPVIDRLAALGFVLSCTASLRGGWDRGPGEWANFGIWLHIATPTELLASLDGEAS